MKPIGKILFALILLLLFFDIGNLNAIRQGTEGFYLLISQEMYEVGDLLSPRVYGDYHWSKPPLQFWFPMPFYKVFGGSYLLWARISILLFSLISCFLISQWYEEETKRNWHEAFGFLLFPIYFIKYSRIFMMEMTLTYLSTLSILYFYSYLKRGRTKTLLLASFIGGLSVLVKGPVSLVMIGPPACLIGLLKFNRNLKRPILFMTVSFLIGCIWFLLSYFKFGEEFFNYFFIRENLGKFNARNYPITSVIQGLLIYSFPAILLIIPIIQNRSSITLKSKLNVFLILSFCSFYFLWFLPKQKSHHYAVPSLPLFLLFISYNFNLLRSEAQRIGIKILNTISIFIFGTGLLILSLIYYFKTDLNPANLATYLLGAFFCLSIWSYLNKKSFLRLRYLKFMLPIIFLWEFILPMGILPTVPSKAAELMQSGPRVFVAYRKPFFVKEAIQKDIELFPADGLTSHEIKKNDLVFIGSPDIKKSLETNRDFKILSQWTVWRRGAKVKDIFLALKSKSLRGLQEKFLLIQKI